MIAKRSSLWSKSKDRWTLLKVINKLLEITEFVSSHSSQNMATASSKGQPLLSKSKSYEGWLNLMKIWRMYADLQETHQGPVLILSQESEAQDAALEIDEKKKKLMQL